MTVTTQGFSQSVEEQNKFHDFNNGTYGVQIFNPKALLCDAFTSAINLYISTNINGQYLYDQVVTTTVSDCEIEVRFYNSSVLQKGIACFANPAQDGWTIEEIQTYLTLGDSETFLSLGDSASRLALG